MKSLLFTFQTTEVANQFDLTRLGTISARSGDGLQAVVEPEDDWATASNLTLILLAFGLHGSVFITEDLEEARGF